MATNVNLLDRAPDTLIRALGWALAPFEDPKGLDRPLVRDGSRWQEDVNFAISAANGVLMWMWRTGISWGYQDPWFASSWPQIKAFGMYRTGYHVIYPKESVAKQVDNWYKIMPEIDVIPRVIDLEVRHDATPEQIANTTWGVSELVHIRDGVRPIIYSRYLLINEWLKSWSDTMLNGHKYILAQYLWDRTREHPGPPTLPDRVKRENVIMHQTADKKAGFPGEVPSNSVDYCRWELGNEANMHFYITKEWGDDEPTPLPPPDDCPCQDQIDALNEGFANTTLRIGLLEDKQAKTDESLNLHNEGIMRNMSTITNLTADLAYLEARVSDLEAGASPTDLYRNAKVTSDKTLACEVKGNNDKGYPIITGNIYEPRKRYNLDETIKIYNTSSIRADGGSYWYVIAPGVNGQYTIPDTPVLYVNQVDVSLS